MLLLLNLACTTAREQGPFLDPAFQPYIPTGTQTIVAARIERLSKTQFMRALVERGATGPLTFFERTFGINPFRDLWEVLALEAEGQITALVRGSVSQQGLEPMVHWPGAVRFRLAGLPAIGTGKLAVAFLNPSTMLLGEPPYLQRLIENPLSSRPPVLETARALPGDTLAWLVSSGPTRLFHYAIPPSLRPSIDALFQDCQVLAAGLSMEEGLLVTVIARPGDGYPCSANLESFLKSLPVGYVQAMVRNPSDREDVVSFRVFLNWERLEDPIVEWLRGFE